MILYLIKIPVQLEREFLLFFYALLLRKKNFVISSATAGMSASPSTTLHSRPVRKCVLKIGCRNGTEHTSNSSVMESPTAYCMCLFEKTPILMYYAMLPNHPLRSIHFAVSSTGTIVNANTAMIAISTQGRLKVLNAACMNGR